MENKKPKHGRQGEGGGKPPKYTATTLKPAIVDYFDNCKETHVIPSKAGVCFFLKIDKVTYSVYRKKYPTTIKGCDLAIEMAWINRLNGNSPTGAIFYLKNAFKEDYKDKHETDITSGGLRIDFDPTFKK